MKKLGPWDASKRNGWICLLLFFIWYESALPTLVHAHRTPHLHQPHHMQALVDLQIFYLVVSSLHGQWMCYKHLGPQMHIEETK